MPKSDIEGAELSGTQGDSNKGMKYGIWQYGESDIHDSYDSSCPYMLGSCSSEYYWFRSPHPSHHVLPLPVTTLSIGSSVKFWVESGIFSLSNLQSLDEFPLSSAGDIWITSGLPQLTRKQRVVLFLYLCMSHQISTLWFH